MREKGVGGGIYYREMLGREMLAFCFAVRERVAFCFAFDVARQNGWRPGN